MGVIIKQLFAQEACVITGYVPQAGSLMLQTASLGYPAGSGPMERELLEKQSEAKSSHSVLLERKSILMCAHSYLSH